MDILCGPYGDRIHNLKKDAHTYYLSLLKLHRNNTVGHLILETSTLTSVMEKDTLHHTAEAYK